MLALELLEAMLKPWLVSDPVARHEDKAIEQHPRPNDRNIFQRLLQYNVNVAMHSICVAYPPEI